MNLSFLSDHRGKEGNKTPTKHRGESTVAVSDSFI